MSIKINKRQKRIANILRPYVTSKILDVGCGDTLVAKYLNKKRIIGIDVVRPKKENILFFLFDGKKIPFKDKEFDTVICSFVLHHAIDQKKLILEMKRVGKKIVILEDCCDSLTDWFVVQSLHLYLLLKYKMPFSVKGFHSLKKWELIFKEAGLIVKKERHVKAVYPWKGLHHNLFVLSSD
jgi:ubiquinone/menaquinone biosynthesis C-methylase UbiE